MTTNDMLIKLHQMIAPIGWEEEGFSRELVDMNGVWQIDRELADPTIIDKYEAQNHICMAAIEWLRPKVVLLSITVSPNGWCIDWLWKEDVDDSPGDQVRALTLLEALHAAVEKIS